MDGEDGTSLERKLSVEVKEIRDAAVTRINIQF